MNMSRKQFTYIFFFITFLIMLLDKTDNVPGTSILRNIRYFYILFLLQENVFKIGIKKWNSNVLFYLILVVFHTVLFGLFIVNPAVLEAIHNHFRQMLIYYLLCILQARYTYYTDTKEEFIISSCAAVTLFLTWCYLTHLNGFAPIRYFFRLPELLRSRARYGFTFGTGHYNFIGNCAFVGIVLLMLIRKYKDYFRGMLSRYWYYWNAFLWIVCVNVLISSASRSSILSCALLLSYYFMQKISSLFPETLLKQAFRYLAIILVLFVVSGLLIRTFEPGSISNRDQNFVGNYAAFVEYNHPWTGMGYTDNFGFLTDAFGYDTYPCDVYYLYIFFTTGILGSLILGIANVFLGMKILRNRDDKGYINMIVKALFITSIFDNLYHCSFASYYYIQSLFVLIIFLVHLYEVKRIKLRGR